jgi:truncated hemoglobin YjbI
MWTALKGGPGLRDVLEDFYATVYADSELSPFFVDVPIERAIQKQYAFMRSIFTGDATYMGDRPRNAHHWMVISDDLFDRREALMRAALQRYGLEDHLVSAWLRIDETYRKHIVKDVPRPRRVGGLEVGHSGTRYILLEVESICDGCAVVIASGAEVSYCARTGRVRCTACSGDASRETATVAESAGGR